MVGGGSAAARAVVKHRIAFQFRRKPKHVGHASGYALRSMFGSRDCKVARKYRKWIDEYRVASVAPPYAALLGRAVGLAQEARALCERTRIHLGSARHDARRVELHLYVPVRQLYIAHLHSFQSLEVAACQRPFGTLGRNEFLYLFCRNSHVFTYYGWPL